MALGGGTWISQNKELPGAYINFVSLANASASLSDRGVATIPLELDWGSDNEIITLTAESVQTESLKLIGMSYTDDGMKGLRDFFINGKTLLTYRLNSGGTKATNDLATAKYSGVKGNSIKIVIQKNVDDSDKFDVSTYIDTTKVDEQTVSEASELVANDFVSFKTSTMELAITAGTPLAGGTNGTVDGSSYQSYLDKIESYTYNAMGVVTTEATIISLFVAFQKRMRDEQGKKFQTVVYRSNADYLGVISAKNKTTDEGWSEASLVYWLTGIECACPVQSSCEARQYNGEFTVDTDYTQTELKQCIKQGQLVLHKVNDNIEILVDINTLVTLTDTCGEVFQDNQTIRVIDQLGNDDAILFNTKYRGKIPNKKSGRTALWSDLVKIRKKLQELGAIEDFSDSDVQVEQGDTKKSVVVNNSITVVNAMSKLYMTTTVK